MRLRHRKVDICPHCRIPYDATPAERAFFAQSTAKEKDMFWRGAGCNLCATPGIRTAPSSTSLQVTEPIKKLIVADAGYEAIRALAVAEGMRTLRDEVLRPVFVQ